MSRRIQHASSRRSDVRSVPVGRRISGARVVYLDENGAIVDLDLDRLAVLPPPAVEIEDQLPHLEEVEDLQGFDPSQVEVDVTVVGFEENSKVFTVWPSSDPEIRNKAPEELEKFAQSSIGEIDLAALATKIRNLPDEHGNFLTQEEASGPKISRGNVGIGKMDVMPDSPKLTEGRGDDGAEEQNRRRLRLQEIREQNERRLAASRKRLERFAPRAR